MAESCLYNGMDFRKYLETKKLEEGGELYSALASLTNILRQYEEWLRRFERLPRRDPRILEKEIRVLLQDLNR